MSAVIDQAPDTTFKLNDMQRMMQDMVRQFCEKELLPKIPEVEETGNIGPIMQKMVKTFGIGQMAEAGLKKQIARLRNNPEDDKREGPAGGMGGDMMMPFILFKELSRVSPGFAMSFGVSIGLAGGAIQKKGRRISWSVGRCPWRRWIRSAVGA